MIQNGTRNPQSFYYGERPETRFPNGRYSEDVGMSKRANISAIFAGSLISDNAGAFNFSVFKAGEQIIVWGSASNNGVHTILSISSASLTVDWPLVTEGPTASLEIRAT